MHFALRLAGSTQENETLWSTLPPLEGANKFHDVAAGAVVLAEAGSDKPLLVAHAYGDGRVMAFAGDSTWRWWMRGYESAFKRFWRQIVLWLARKDQAQEGNLWIRMAQRRFRRCNSIQFLVGARASGEPLPEAVYKAELIGPDGSRRPLPLMRQEEQMAGSVGDLQAAGDYTIEVSATDKGQPLGSTRARFLVFEQDLELDNAAADAPTMESLRGDDRRPIGPARATVRTPESDRQRDAISGRAARDEEDLLGHVVLFPRPGQSARCGVVPAEARGLV